MKQFLQLHLTSPLTDLPLKFSVIFEKVEDN